MSAGRPNIYRAAVLRELAASTSTTGMNNAELVAATGMTSRRVSGALTGMVEDGVIFLIPLHKSSRYFATAEQRDAATAEVIADRRKQVADRKRENDRKSIERKKQRYANDPEFRAKMLARDRSRRPAKKAAEQAKAKAAPKPVKPPKVVKLAQPKPVNREATARQKWSEQEPIIPPNVKVQRCPGYTGVSRFRADVGFVGPFLRAGVGRYE